MVLFTERFAISHSLKKTLKKVQRSMSTDRRWEIRFDSAFEQVMHSCAAPRKDGAGTWISDDIIQGYVGLHQQGFAHSSEVWLDGELVGGAYGVCIGRMFYGESIEYEIETESGNITATIPDPHADQTFGPGDLVEVGFEAGRAWLLPVDGSASE